MKLIFSNTVKHYTVDASLYNYGRLCSYVANLLLDKESLDRNFAKPSAVVKIKNIEKIHFSKTAKLDNHKFYSHSGYPGGLKVRTLKSYIEGGRIKTCFIISLRGMLSKTKLYRHRLLNNVIFE